MFAPSTLAELVSGRRRGIGPWLFRAIASAIEFPVAWYVHRKNQSFDLQPTLAQRVGSPVISVGNLTVGGTGKTPLVQYLAEHLQQHGQKVVLISRGYGQRSAEEANDEARELALKLPGVPHFQNRDRVAAAHAAVATYPDSVLLLDDAFQHRRLHRDLDIVLLDALAPFGYDHVLPRGLLREPVAGLSRAHVVVLSRANLIDAATRCEIRARVATIAPHALWAEAIHAPQYLVNAAEEKFPLELLRGKRSVAFCGIGNPAGFRGTLNSLGTAVAAFKEFPDHFPYREAQLIPMEKLIRRQKPDFVVCTQKDLVKIPRTHIADRPLFALSIGLSFLGGETQLGDALQNLEININRSH